MSSLHQYAPEVYPDECPETPLHLDYEPTAEDWADYAEWLAELDAAIWEARLEAEFELWLDDQRERDRERDEAPRVGAWGGHAMEGGRP